MRKNARLTMEKKTIKSSFMGGYSKKDVNKFISDMSSDFKRQSQQKDETIEFERTRADKAEAQLKLSSEKLDEIAAIAYSFEQKQKELEKRIESLEQEKALLSYKLDEMAISAKVAIDNLETTREKLEKEYFKNTINEQKLDVLACETYEAQKQSKITEDVYSKLDGRIEDIFREADSKATEIVRRAQSIAEEMVNETKEKTRNYRANLEDNYKIAVSEYKENVNAAVDNLLRAVAEGSDELSQRIDNVDSVDMASKPMNFSNSDQLFDKKANVPSKKRDYISSINEKIEMFFKGAISALNSLINKNK